MHRSRAAECDGGPSSFGIRNLKQLLAYLQLCRAANVFTAMADIFLGYLLTHDSLQPATQFALLLVSSSTLYIAGMVFNDVFDREVDVRERPGRPIPSGRVTLRSAVILGGVLVLTGLAAATIAGPRSAVVAAALVGCIFLYDGVLKSTVVGPVAMGGCRFLNVMLGASAAASAQEDFAATLAAVWTMPQLHVAGALGLYIAGVTWFARNEAGRSGRVPLVAAMGVINLGLALLVAFALNWPGGVPDRSLHVALVLGLIALTINRRSAVAVLNPSPANVQRAIKTLLMSLVMLDATVILFVQPNMLYAVAVVALLVPALVLSRFLAVT